MTDRNKNGQVIDLGAIRERRQEENTIALFMPLFRDQIAMYGPEGIIFDVAQKTIVLGSPEAEEVGLTQDLLQSDGPEMKMHHTDTEAFWADLIAARGLNERVLPEMYQEDVEWEAYRLSVNEILYDPYYRSSHFYYICEHGVSIKSLERLNNFFQVSMGMGLMTPDDAYGIEGIQSTFSRLILDGCVNDFELMEMSIRNKIKIGEIERQIPGNLLDEDDLEILDRLKEKLAQIEAMKNEDEEGEEDPPVFASVTDRSAPPDQSA